jgi:hypothetical protein
MKRLFIFAPAKTTTFFGSKKRGKKLQNLFGRIGKKFLYLHPHFEERRDKKGEEKKSEVDLKINLEK